VLPSRPLRISAAGDLLYEEARLYDTPPVFLQVFIPKGFKSEHEADSWLTPYTLMPKAIRLLPISEAAAAMGWAAHTEQL
jgi:hypothetical protein